MRRDRIERWGGEKGGEYKKISSSRKSDVAITCILLDLLSSKLYIQT